MTLVARRKRAVHERRFKYPSVLDVGVDCSVAELQRKKLICQQKGRFDERSTHFLLCARKFARESRHVNEDLGRRKT